MAKTLHLEHILPQSYNGVSGELDRRACLRVDAQARQLGIAQSEKERQDRKWTV